MILISKVRTSVSTKINLMALIRILTISTTTFERMKEKFYGFRQTVLCEKFASFNRGLFTDFVTHTVYVGSSLSKLLILGISEMTLKLSVTTLMYTFMYTVY